MTCIKTGCLVYLEQYGEYVYGDAFEVSSVLVLRIVARYLASDTELVQHGVMRHITVNRISEWWDKELTSQNNVTVLVAPPFGWTNHGYDGVHDFTLKKLLEKWRELQQSTQGDLA